MFSTKLPLLDIKLLFWMYGINLVFLDAYYLLTETVEENTWNPTMVNNIIMEFVKSLK